MADRFTADATITPLAYHQITSLAAATGISGGAGRVALIQALDQNVRWRDDGVDPTGTVGMRLAAGETMFYVGDLKKIKFIEEAASAEINLSVYE